jgi:predicted dinucleotide-binding enzyme
MRVGCIGAGTMAQTFGRHLLGAGHEIVVSNSRGPATLAEITGWRGDGASAGTKQEAVDCDVTLLATN